MLLLIYTVDVLEYISILFLSNADINCLNKQ